ncbi:MAG: hypothetical protein INH41_31585 [Myxococcaceae bacterium]|nr:hypothetical protein [Myxococcaceae bacterium]MCA3016949.1 hypothetical protein [Myxococcaceae bacterium]
MRAPLLLLVSAIGCSSLSPIGDCSPANCGGCCDARGQCQTGVTREACGSGGFRCASCGDTQRCRADATCELDPNAPRGGGSAGGGSAGGTPGLTPPQQEYVTAHNTARRAALPTPSPPLADVTWDAEAEAFATVGATRCIFEHRDQNQYGENLYAAAQDSRPSVIVKAWDDEKTDYTYSTNTCRAGAVCGHYTQVVWRSSTKLGCATARCTVNSPFRGFPIWFLTACNYSPPGNYVGQRPY